LSIILGSFCGCLFFLVSVNGYPSLPLIFQLNPVTFGGVRGVRPVAVILCRFQAYRLSRQFPVVSR
jgi:hypothetical protein